MSNFLDDELKMMSVCCFAFAFALLALVLYGMFVIEPRAKRIGFITGAEYALELAKDIQDGKDIVRLKYTEAEIDSILESRE